MSIFSLLHHDLMTGCWLDVWLAAWSIDGRKCLWTHDHLMIGSVTRPWWCNILSSSL